MQTSCLIWMLKWLNEHKYLQRQTVSTLPPWKALLIDQSALTAVWRELMTLWLQRVCVQWPCKGSLALTRCGGEGASALPCPGEGDAHTQTHTNTCAGRDSNSTPKPLRYAQPQSSKCVHPVWRWRHRQLRPPPTLHRSRLCPRPAPPSLWAQGEQVQQGHCRHTD